MSSRAWVTLATNDSYSLGALVVAHSLKRAGSVYPAVVLITPSVTDAMRDRLSAVFAEVIVVNVLDSEDAAHLALLQRPELGVTFTKIHCWNLTQYEKCVFLDADTLIIRNCDELFEREELSAAPDVGWPDCFNTGVFVFSPSKETFENLIKFAQERGSFDGGDQGLLNSFFSDWARGDINKHLPFLYNVTSAAFYSYLPALKHYGQDLKIIHFIGAAKPWLQRFNWESRSVDAPEHLKEFLQLWWDLFVSQIHTQLDTSMVEVEQGPPEMPPQDVFKYYTPTIDPDSEFPWHRPSQSDDDDVSQKLDTSQFYDPWKYYQGNYPPYGNESQSYSNVGRAEAYDLTKYVWDYKSSNLAQSQSVTYQEHGSIRESEQPKHVSHDDQRREQDYLSHQHVHQDDNVEHQWLNTQNDTDDYGQNIWQPQHNEHAQTSYHNHSQYDEHQWNNEQSQQNYYHERHLYNLNEQTHVEYKIQVQSETQHEHSHEQYQLQSHQTNNFHQHDHSNSRDVNHFQDHHSQRSQWKSTQHHEHSSGKGQPNIDHDYFQQSYAQKLFTENTISHSDPQTVVFIHQSHNDKDGNINHIEKSLNNEVIEKEFDYQEEIICRHPYDGYYLRHRPVIDSRGRKLCTHEIPPVSSPSPSLSNHLEDEKETEELPEETIFNGTDDQSGVAGNLARVVPGTVDFQREAVDELTRRQGWEAGNIDYMGADSFDNIWAKISQTLNQSRSSPPKQPSPPKEQPKVLAADKVEVFADDKAVDAVVLSSTVDKVQSRSSPPKLPLPPKEQPKVLAADEVEVLVDDKAVNAAVLSSTVDKVDTPSPMEIPTMVESAPVVAAAPVVELEPLTKPTPVVEEVLVVKAAPGTQTMPAVEPTLAIKAAPAVAAVPVAEAEATLFAEPTTAIPLHAPPVKIPAHEDIPIPVEAALESATLTKTSPKEEAAPVSKTVPEPVKSSVTSDTIAAAPLSTDDLEEKTEKAQTSPVQLQSAPKPIVEAVSKVDVPTEAPKSVEKTPEKAKEALAPVAKPPLKITPEKPTDVSASSTDSPPLVNTPSKDEVLQQSSAKSEERRKPVGKLHLSPPADADPLPTPDSELEDAASLAQSIIASELRTPTVSSPSPSTSPASPPAPIQEKRLSVEEPEVPTPPVASPGAVSLAQIGVKPSKGKSSTASLIETSLLEKSADTAATPVASPPKTPSTPSSPSDASKKKAPELPTPSAPKTSVPPSPKSPSTDALKKKAEKKPKEGASSAEMPVPPPRKKEKKPKDK